jgi:hypothetical protein
MTRNPLAPHRRSIGMERRSRVAALARQLALRFGPAAGAAALERARAARLARDYQAALAWLDVALRIARREAAAPRATADLAYARTLERPPERPARGLAAFARRLKEKRARPT